MAMAIRWKSVTNVTETDMLSSPVGSAMAMATLGVLHVQGQAATNASPARVEAMTNVVGVMVLAGMMERPAFHVPAPAAMNASPARAEVMTTALRAAVMAEWNVMNATAMAK